MSTSVMAGSPGSPASTATVPWAVAVDAGARDLARAEHLAAGLVAGLPVGVPDLLISTHLVGSPRHVAVVAAWSGPAADQTGLEGVVARLALPVDAAVLLRAGERHLVSGPEDRQEAARVALAEHAGRAAGRLVHYPGQADVQRPTTVGDVVRLSCIDRVDVLAGLPAEASTPVDLTGFARPQWRDGICVLLVQPAAGGLVPFEVRDQIACCDAH